MCCLHLCAAIIIIEIRRGVVRAVFAAPLGSGLDSKSKLRVVVAVGASESGCWSCHSLPLTLGSYLAFALVLVPPQPRGGGRFQHRH